MINGIVNVYKEKGFTSFDVVAKMRGMFHQKKIGHTGTLDPGAEGVLPVCLGKATKVCDLLTDKDKEYKAVLYLGKETDTQDFEGETLNSCSVTVSEQEVRDTILSFVGTYDQVPPMYSALKVNGQKLCDLARKGITVERKSRTVKIHKIDIKEINLPEVTMVVSCSKGTYIRTLCDDIGKKLGCYGCMKSLLRTKVDRFILDKAYTLSELQQIIEKEPEENWGFILPIDDVFDMYMAIVVKEEVQKLLLNGNSIPVTMTRLMSQVIDSSSENHAFSEEISQNSLVRIYDYTHKFIGIYKYIEESNEYKPVKLFME